MTQHSAPSETRLLSSASSDSIQEDRLLHILSNKLLPIVVFADLALRRCGDEQVKQQLEKIHSAAEQARDILLEIRALHAQKSS